MKVETWFAKKTLEKNTKAAAVKPLRECASLIKTEAQRVLNVGGGSDHEPSTPPDAPHKQSSTLQQSISIAETDRGTVVIGPTTQAWYGKLHEFGHVWVTKTGHTAHMPARPFMRPALEHMRSQFAEKFTGIPIAEPHKGDS